MTEWRRDDLINALLVSPAGAALLARLETEQRDKSDQLPDRFRWLLEGPSDVDATAVDRATASLVAQSAGAVLATAVSAAESVAGSWLVRSPDSTAAALRDAPARAKIAVAVLDRLSGWLETPMDRSSQEWWWSNHQFPAADPWMNPLGGPRKAYTAWVTATGDGLWTVTSPEDEIADDLVDVWEIFPGPISRWRLRVDPTARIFEVNQPTDWEHLATKYPLAGERQRGWGWELPDPKEKSRVGALAALEGQRAMRTRMNRFVEPSWDAVAEDWDGVHLTWAGFLTTEGLVIDLGGDDVAMLRGWHSERTLWLNPVLSDPTPAPAPALSGRINGYLGIDADANPARRAQDLDWLTYRLNR